MQSQNNKNKKIIKSKKTESKRKKNNNNNIQPTTPSQDPNTVINNIPNDIVGDNDCPPLPTPTSNKANDCSASNKQNFRIYSHNVQGLRDEAKLEYLPRLMKKKNINAYLIQETHLPGTFEKYIYNDYYLIHHGPDNQPANGAKGGIAIILSPELTTQWKSSGKAKKITTGGISTSETTRILSISMKFEIQQPPNSKKQTKKNFHNLCLTTVYFPHSGYQEKELDAFTDDLYAFLSNILLQRNTTHIIGADTNSSIGTNASLQESQDKQDSRFDIDPALSLLGPFGNPYRSKTGENLLNLMREFQLRAAATFFDNNNKYNTWLAPPHPTTRKRRAYQLDQILIPKHQLRYTTNVKRRFDGATSDHAALFIEFHLPKMVKKKKKTPEIEKKKSDVDAPPPVQKINNNILRNKELPNFQKKVNEYFSNLQPEKAELLSPSELLDKFEEHIFQAAHEVATREQKKRPDWFTKRKKPS